MTKNKYIKLFENMSDTLDVNNLYIVAIYPEDSDLGKVFTDRNDAQKYADNKNTMMDMKSYNVFTIKEAIKHIIKAITSYNG